MQLLAKLMRVVYCEEDLFTEGLRIFKQHPDKEWSLTNCVSFVTMRKYGIRTAFTLDARFKQFGFMAIP